MTAIYVGSLRQRAGGLPHQITQQLESTSNQLLAASLPENLPPETKARVERARVAAFLGGYRIIMFIAAGLAALSAGVAAVTVTSKKLRSSD